MYETFYRLTAKPFSVTPDPRFLFLSESHKEALANLLSPFAEEQVDADLLVLSEERIGLGAKFKDELAAVRLQSRRRRREWPTALAGYPLVLRMVARGKAKQDQVPVDEDESVPTGVGEG